MKQLIALFKKVGGKNLLLQYWQSHTLLFFILASLLLGFKKKSLEIVRLAVNNRGYQKLRKKYLSEISILKKSYDSNLKRVRSNKVWILWLQGKNNAPPLVQRCISSLQENLQDRDVVILTEENYRAYVSFPKFIQDKINCGIITRTHFSDLLRLELLIKYGGTWIDATVFCSGNNYPKYILDSDLFVYQCMKPGLDGHSTSISSWLMTASTNNPIIMMTRDLLYKYWEKNNKMCDYFLIHDFFQMSIESYPEEWKRVIPFSNSTPHILLLRLFDSYDENIWTAVKNQTCFHKLSYKLEQDVMNKEFTFYSEILGK